jgi:hypothetical protein
MERERERERGVAIGFRERSMATIRGGFAAYNARRPRGIVVDTRNVIPTIHQTASAITEKQREATPMREFAGFEERRSVTPF